MRYGLTLVPQGAFPTDVGVGIQLQDEPAVIVPDEPAPCPECPGACEPTCVAWWITIAGVQGLPDSFHFAAAQPQFFSAVSSPSTINVNVHDFEFATAWDPSDFLYAIVTPNIQRCGHRTRFVITQDSNDPGGYTQLPGADANSMETIWVIWGPPWDTPNWSTAIKLQIDLTDAAPGSETWTDICSTINLRNHA